MPAPTQAGWDPISHLPRGRRLGAVNEAALTAAFAANLYQPLSTEQIEAAAGADLPAPTSIARAESDPDTPALRGFLS